LKAKCDTEIILLGARKLNTMIADVLPLLLLLFVMFSHCRTFSFLLTFILYPVFCHFGPVYCWPSEMFISTHAHLNRGRLWD